MLQPGELLTHHRCRGVAGPGSQGCRQPIAFRFTRTGAQLPIDPLPSPKGNVALVGAEGNEIAETLSPDRIGEAYDGFLYVSHFATCPQAAAFRKAQLPVKDRLVESKLHRETIEAFATRFAHECQAQKLDVAGMQAKFRREHPSMLTTWKEDPALRRRGLEAISARVRELLGLPPRQDAA